MIEITLEKPGLSGSVYKRTAARGVILREGKLLMIHTDRGDYKFPGGGVEPGRALRRRSGGSFWRRPDGSFWVSRSVWPWPMSAGGG